MNETIREHSWIPLILVACASFIITLDSTFMNVSISQVVADLNTTVSTIQMTMAFYTLITAAFMLLSTKLQDIVGKKRLFLIGAVLYGIGTFIAAISQSDTMLFIGWAVIEGLAGALMRRSCRGINDTCNRFHNKWNIFRRKTHICFGN